MTTRSAVDATELRAVCSHFATGVSVVTSGPVGTPSATTVNSFTSVSLEPPLILICLGERSSLRPVVRRHGFVVNFLAYEQEKLAWAFAGRRPPGPDDIVPAASATGRPVLRDALAYLSCRLFAEHEAGDHSILLGEVEQLGTHHREREPLVFYRGAMRPLPAVQIAVL